MKNKRTGSDGREHYSVADHIRIWIGEGNGSIHIRTDEPQGDPVELGEGEVEDLIEVLKSLLEKIR